MAGMGMFLKRGILRLRPKNKLARQAYRANEAAIAASLRRERDAANLFAAFRRCGEGLATPSGPPAPPNARPSP